MSFELIEVVETVENILWKRFSNYLQAHLICSLYEKHSKFVNPKIEGLVIFLRPFICNQLQSNHFQNWMHFQKSRQIIYGIQNL